MAVFNNYGYGGGLFGLGGSQGAYYGGGMGDGVFTGTMGMNPINPIFGGGPQPIGIGTVSYTHLTLPTSHCV